MKYALLIYTTPGMVDGFSNGELEAMSSEYFALRDEPGCITGGHLEDVATATTVRVDDGQTTHHRRPVRGDQGGVRRLLRVRAG